MSQYTLINNQTVAPETSFVSELKNISGPKQMVDIYPTEGGFYGYSAGKRQATFEIGSPNYHLIPNESYLEFNLELTTGTTGYITGDVSALFNSVRVLNQNGLEIVREESHNLFASAMNHMVVSNENKNLNWVSNLQDLGVADASAQNLAAKKKFCITPNMNFFKMLKSVPLPVTGQLRVVIDFEQDAEAFFGASTLVYKVSDLKFVAAMLPVSNDYNDRLKQLALKGGLVIPFSQNHHSLHAADSTNNTMYIRQGFANAKTVIAVNRLSTDQYVITKGNLHQYLRPQGTFNLIEVRNGSNTFPSNTIDSVERAYTETLKTLNLYHDIDAGNQVTRALYTTATVVTSNMGSTAPKFVVAIDLTSNGQNTGINTVNSGIQYILNSGTATDDLNTDIFVEYGCDWIIRDANTQYLKYV